MLILKQEQATALTEAHTLTKLIDLQSLTNPNLPNGVFVYNQTLCCI